MLPLVNVGDPGVDLPLIIDGVELAIMPSAVELTPDPISDYQDNLDGGSREWQRRPHFDGVADHMDRYTLAVPIEQLSGAALQQLERIRVNGGVHQVTLWKFIPVTYTCRGGVQQYYLPRMRRFAGWYHAGMLLAGGVTVNTTRLPTLATLNGDPLEVTYAEGPTLVAPGAGGLVVSRQPLTSGDAAEYTPMLLGDAVVTGDRLELWTFCTLQMSLRSPQVRLHGTVESHAYTFVEV